MRKFLFIILLCVGLSSAAFAQGFSISGTVLSQKDGSPIEAAVVSLPESSQWAVSDAKGRFSISKVPSGKVSVEVSCLGYAPLTTKLEIIGRCDALVFKLLEDNLALDGATVTAKENSSSSTTVRTIERTAMDHMQMTNVSDLMSLLPGGKTTNPDLSTTGSTRFEVRTKGETGATFGTAVEVDGVRLSNNAALDETAGVNTKNIASADVESVEVITGVPSVEYGDMSSGIVKVHTKKGKTPYQITMSLSPRTKQIAFSKGFDLGIDHRHNRRGSLNASLERASSTSNLASPYSSYSRNTLSLSYSNTFGSGVRPLSFSAGISGNIGGSNTKSDPDAYKSVYSKTNDNALRGNVSLKWLLNASWITNLELRASFSYSDRKGEALINRSTASSISAAHGKEQGYFQTTDYDLDPSAAILLVEPGYWDQKSFTDSKPLDYNIALKADWAHKWGRVSNRVKLGAQFSGSGNLGKGQYYGDLKTAPSWREWRYDQIPWMNNFSAYLEENLSLSLGPTILALTAGVRTEQTMVSRSSYGNVGNWSPRFNGKLTILPYEATRKVQELSIRGGWGLAVKLPSFNILYPQPVYKDIQTFAPATTADNKTYSAYYIQPQVIEYNKDLRWQYNRQCEVGAELRLSWVDVSLSAYFNKSLRTYRVSNHYDRFSYAFSDQRALEGLNIPSADREYTIDKVTGIVSVRDRSGAKETVELPYIQKNGFMLSSYADNGSPSYRTGVEWVLNFAQIKAIRTSFRLDGAYYNYRTLDQTIRPYSPGGQLSDGRPYQYVGWYVGGASPSNGSKSEDVSLNLTVTTHIPSIRMIISLKLESELYSYSTVLSQKSGAPRSYTRGEDDPYSIGGEDIYNKDSYVITYPEYYTCYDSDTPVAFKEKFQWAKTNDPALYSALSKLVVQSNYGYSFNERKLSPYFAANVSVTKEIGKIASISFYANNFFNNMGRVHSSQNNSDLSLYGSNYIPSFYYGLTLRLKF